MKGRKIAEFRKLTERELEEIGNPYDQSPLAMVLDDGTIITTSISTTGGRFGYFAVLRPDRNQNPDGENYPDIDILIDVEDAD